MGFAFGLFLLPARVAGEFITQQVGLNVAPQTGPTGTGTPPAPIYPAVRDRGGPGCCS